MLLFEPDDSEARIAFRVWNALGLSGRHASAYRSGHTPLVVFDVDCGDTQHETPTILRVKAFWLSAALAEPPENWPLRPDELPPEWTAALLGWYGFAIAEVVEATLARWNFLYENEAEDEVVTPDGHAL